MMADKTEDEEERLEEPQPHIAANIEGIAGLIGPNGRVAKAEEEGQKARGKLGNAYQKIEKDYHGNIQAAKKVRALLAGTKDAAFDFLRTFIPLCEHFDLMPDVDLADQAAGAAPGGKVFSFPDRGKPRGAEALDAARAHLGTGTKAEEESPAAKRKREYGFDENAPPGEPGDGDLARAGGPDPDAEAAE